MADKFPSSRVFSGRHDDLLIEALAPVEGGAEYAPVIFRTSYIALLRGLPDDKSAIVLQNGVVIPVMLPCQKLKEIVYSPDIKDGNGVDLSSVTGPAAEGVEMTALAEKFNRPAVKETQLPQKPLPQKPLRLRLFLEDNEGKAVFLINALREEEIGTLEIRGSDRSRSYLALAKGKVFADTGKNHAWINMPLTLLMERVTHAKHSGMEFLDLLEETRRKPAAPPPVRP